jgi:serine protease inhibitor ecotin
MQVQVLSIQPQSNQDTFTVTIQMGQAVEDFCLTAKDTFVGARSAHLIEGDEHFEHTFTHLEGLRGQISSLVTEVFLGHPLRLPIILDDSTLPVRVSASA